jgi:hypothetical protein
MLEYVHFVPGRLRLKHSRLRDYREAAEARVFAAKIRSVRTAAVNPATGSLTITFDQHQLSIEELWDFLTAGQYVSGRCPVFAAIDSPSRSGLEANRFGRAVVDAVVEALVRHSASALVRKLL